jgi:hypothetical protein
MWVSPTIQHRFHLGLHSRGLVPVVLLALGLVPALAGHAHAQATALDSTATLLWTAPGDDGTAGLASRYEMRYRSTPVSAADTVAWWNGAAVVAGMPRPGSPGVTDSVNVTGLDPRATWYFVLKTADEVPNWSNFSNIAVRPPYVDTVSPAAIADLASGFIPNAPSLPASVKQAIPTRR